MKYLRTYESLSEPEIGDYVYCKNTTDNNKEFDKFLEFNIGKIMASLPHLRPGDIYVKFDNFEESGVDGINHPVNFLRDEILYWSKDKEDVEIYMNSKKYNL